MLTLYNHCLSSDATTYAHFLFNAFDMDRNGSIRFEVSFPACVSPRKSSATEIWLLALIVRGLQQFICRTLCWGYLCCSEARLQRNSDGRSICTISTRMVILLKRYSQHSHQNKRSKICCPVDQCSDCCCFLFPAGNVGNNDIHLWHDGQIYLTQCARWLPLWACGEILPGVWSL